MAKNRKIEKKIEAPQTGPRKVMIATPSYDGKVGVLYADAMLNSVLLGLQHGVRIVPVYFPYEALLPVARNYLLSLAVASDDITDIVWIDADMVWTPDQFVRLLSHNVDVVGGVVPKKSDKLEWNVKALRGAVKVDGNGLAEVAAVGTGFLRMRRKAFMALSKRGASYRHNGQLMRMAFDIAIKNGDLMSEDTHACDKLAGLGFPIYIDVNITAGHTGAKTWTADFATWLSQIKA